MNLDAGTIGALGAVLTGVLAGVAAIMNARRQRAVQTDTDLRAENTRLTGLVKRQRGYIETLYAYAVKLRRELFALGKDPDPIPDEETTP